LQGEVAAAFGIYGVLAVIGEETSVDCQIGIILDQYRYVVAAESRILHRQAHIIAVNAIAGSTITCDVVPDKTLVH